LQLERSMSRQCSMAWE